MAAPTARVEKNGDFRVRRPLVTFCAQRAVLFVLAAPIDYPLCLPTTSLFFSPRSCHSFDLACRLGVYRVVFNSQILLLFFPPIF